MKRHIVVLLILGLIAGSFATTAEAAKKKKKKKPVPIDQTYNIVWGGEACALSTTADLANPDEACADVFWGALGAQLGGGPALIPALDGLPLALDVAKPITGKLMVESWYLTGEVPDVMGIGQAQVDIVLSGTSGGEEIVIGEMSTDPYIVTPASANYEVEFEMQPAEDLAGKVFETLTLSLEVTGMQMFHGVIPADATSTITIGAFTTS